MLYGIDQAKREIAKQGRAVIVEGIEVGTKVQISDGSAAPAAGEPSAEPTEEG